MLFKQQEHRRFDYQPLFYKPEADPEVQRKKRIHFPRYRRPHSMFNRSMVMIMAMLIILFYIVYWIVQRP